MQVIIDQQAIEEIKKTNVYIEPIYGVLLILDIFKDDALIVDPKYYNMSKKLNNKIFSGVIIKVAEDAKNEFSVGERVMFVRQTGVNCKYLNKFNLSTLDKRNIIAKLDKDLEYGI